ncbi:carboxypeptidase-like regulatory domain-containing protein [Flavobacterium zhairuonense]|uniref:carboxypeptidase-like regulatory domain-containing protein n=1 Tax=Flavobacterium zhairuonense TaxID=2493631 RepID=UPI0010429BAC|nr:carboxypeptidase-like regulatory domain-containing protein [Flavobacterium zhairuonense]KAF2512148.1 carboxypeptidase-like regulatory domain-containing protein [Flavobacterium zhairuonense]
MKYTTSLFSFLFTCTIFAQESTISGKLKSTQNNEELDYVNIGITNKNVGTVSNSKGIFKLKLNDKVQPTDTIVFSHIGYETKKILVSQLKETNNSIEMIPSENTLKEVVVSFKKPKPKQFGRSAKGLGLMHSNFFYAFDQTVDDYLSRERGMKFHIKKDCKVDDFNFNITSNEFKSVKFRLNFYKIENDLPSKILIEKDIIFEVKDNKLGLFTVDLKPFDIYLDKEMGDIAVTIQWIESVKSDEKSKFFSISTATSVTESSFYRERNMSNWSKTSQSLTFYLNTMCQ